MWERGHATLPEFLHGQLDAILSFRICQLAFPTAVCLRLTKDLLSYLIFSEMNP
jgi:hypothetical protein